MSRPPSGTIGFLSWALAAACWSVPVGVAAQTVTCELAVGADGTLAGQCIAADQPLRVRLSRADGVSDAIWVGVVETADGPLPIEIATYQYSSGPALIARTQAWHLLSEFVVSEAGLRLAWDAGAEAPPSPLDLEIFESARALLPSEEAWDRQDDRNCENDDGVISVYCALARATASVMGRYQHRQPAMQAVRRVIGEEWPERVVDHRLMDFNNDARTTLADVHHLFDLAAESLRGSIR